VNDIVRGRYNFEEWVVLDSADEHSPVRLQYGEYLPVSNRRTTLVRLLKRIEGLECAKFLIKAQMEQEENQERRANLRAALELLGEASPEDSGQTAVEKDDATRKEVQPPKESVTPATNVQQPPEKENAEWITVVLSVAVVVLAGVVVFLLLRRRR
jgi:multidrug efflux pump subunit AcrB